MTSFGWGGFVGMGVLHITLDIFNGTPHWGVGLIFITLGFFGSFMIAHD